MTSIETSDLDRAAALLTAGSELLRVREIGEAQSFVFRGESASEPERLARTRRLLNRLHPLRHVGYVCGRCHRCCQPSLVQVAVERPTDYLEVNVCDRCATEMQTASTPTETAHRTGQTTESE